MTQQIYSLPHLATLESTHCVMFFWASCRIRTNDPEITNHVLWPTELKRHLSLCKEIRGVLDCGCKITTIFWTDKFFSTFFSKNFSTFPDFSPQHHNNQSIMCEINFSLLSAFFAPFIIYIMNTSFHPLPHPISRDLPAPRRRGRPVDDCPPPRLSKAGRGYSYLLKGASIN